MQARLKRRRFAGTAALITTVAGGGLVAACTPTVPTAALGSGILTISGSAAKDIIEIREENDRVVVDVVGEGATDFSFDRAQVTRIQVVANEGDDAIVVSSSGRIPIDLSGGLGNDILQAVTEIGTTGVGDARFVVNGDDGNDQILAAVPGPITVNAGAGAGADRVEGGGAYIGVEDISLGDGNDVLVGSFDIQIGPRRDNVDGGGGQDILEMDGTPATEFVSLFPDEPGSPVLNVQIAVAGFETTGP